MPGSDRNSDQKPAPGTDGPGAADRKLTPLPEQKLVPDLDFHLPKEASGMRLDAALAPVLPKLGLRARRRLWTWCRVLVNERERSPGFMVRGGDRIRLTGAKDGEEAAPRPVRLVQVAAGLVALDKPAGLHSAHIEGSPEPSLESLLPALWPDLIRQWPGFEAATGPATGPATGVTTGVAAEMAAGVAAGVAAGSGFGSAPGTEPKFLSGPQSGIQSEANTERAARASLLCAAPPSLLTRLDRATSGLVLAALEAGAKERFRRHEELGLTRKSYLALLAGHLDDELRLRARLNTAGGAKSRVGADDHPDPVRHTLVRPLGRAALNGDCPLPDEKGAFTLVRVQIFRGARHQIRAHLAAAGFPLAGEWLYAPAREGAERLYLHHAALETPEFKAHCLPDWLAGWPDAEALLQRDLD